MEFEPEQLALTWIAPLSASLVLMSVLGTFIGAALLLGISVDVFKLCLGVAVLAACAGLSLQAPQRVYSRAALAWVAGLISGLMNGAMAIQAPPIIAYVLVSEPEPRGSRALMMSFLTISAAIALATYSLNDMPNPDPLVYFLLSLPILLLGDCVGSLLFNRYGTVITTLRDRDTVYYRRPSTCPGPC